MRNWNHLSRSLSECGVSITPLEDLTHVEEFAADDRDFGVETVLKKTKKVYLIRHAESQENRRQFTFYKSLGVLGNFSLPTKEDVATSAELLDVNGQIDSDVSEVGKRQIKKLGSLLKQDNFIEKAKIQMVAHSPLRRARQTSEGMLQCVAPGSLPAASESPTFGSHFLKRKDFQFGCDSNFSLPGKIAPTVHRVTELPCLAERTPMERLNEIPFRRRILEFEKWLGEQPEDSIAIVGHSLFFKNMLGASFKFGNCDVWEVLYSPDYHSDGLDVHWEERDVESFQSSGESFDANSENNVDLRPGWSDLKNLYHY